MVAPSRQGIQGGAAPWSAVAAVLPRPTDDVAVAKADLDRFGFCYLGGLLDGDTVGALKDRIEHQATAEEARGLHDHAQGETTNQYIYMMINKGQAFLDLVQHPQVIECVEHVIGADPQLSASDAIICKPGGNFMPLHTDQWWMPAPTPRNVRPVRAGDLRRFTFAEDDDSDPAKPIGPAAAVTVMWMVTDFTEENGATRVVPHSHLSGEQPDPAVPYAVETVAGTGCAGTALIFDGRLWHATGRNSSDAARIGFVASYCGPQFRPMENYTLGAKAETVRSASPRLLSLLGFKVWDGYGKLDDPGDEFISRHQETTGEL